MKNASQRTKKGPAKAATFSAEERAAMREYAAEKKKAARGEASKADGERDLLAKVAEMKEPDRSLAKRVHEIVKANAPDLSPKTWYGMPAYARNDKVVCFFQPAGKFKSRYATFGFSDQAKLDEDAMWPTAFALTRLTAADEARLAALVKRAAGA